MIEYLMNKHPDPVFKERAIGYVLQEDPQYSLVLVEKKCVSAGIVFEMAAFNDNRTVIMIALRYRFPNDPFDLQKALHNASKAGAADAVKTLIGLGVDVNANGSEALQVAIRHKHVDVVTLLLGSGSKLDNYTPANGKIQELTRVLLAYKVPAQTIVDVICNKTPDEWYL